TPSFEKASLHRGQEELRRPPRPCSIPGFPEARAQRAAKGRGRGDARTPCCPLDGIPLLQRAHGQVKADPGEALPGRRETPVPESSVEGPAIASEALRQGGRGQGRNLTPQPFAQGVSHGPRNARGKSRKKGRGPVLREESLNDGAKQLRAVILPFH